jgi:cell division protein FtsL
MRKLDHLRGRTTQLYLKAGFVALLCSAAVTGLSIVDGAQQMRRLYGELGKMQQEHDAVLAENSRLRLERSSISSLQAIEQIANEQLQMQFPDQIEQVLP